MSPNLSYGIFSFNGFRASVKLDRQPEGRATIDMPMVCVVPVNGGRSTANPWNLLRLGLASLRGHATFPPTEDKDKKIHNSLGNPQNPIPSIVWDSVTQMLIEIGPGCYHLFLGAGVSRDWGVKCLEDPLSSKSVIKLV